MAELIRKEDTLNEGRIKLNNAISDAEQAKNTAGQADSKATQALANSESTQTQLDTIVIEGDSSVEAAQARVDEKGVGHTTLKDRIDDGFTKVTSQLNDTKQDINERGINIKEYAYLVSNEDWGDALESAISDVHDSGGGIILIPSGEYVYGKDIHVKENVKIEGVDGSELIQENNAKIYFYSLSNLSNIKINVQNDFNEGALCFENRFLRRNNTDLSKPEGVKVYLSGVDIITEFNELTTKKTAFSFFSTRSDVANAHGAGFSRVTIENSSVTGFNTAILMDTDLTGWVNGNNIECSMKDIVHAVKIIRSGQSLGVDYNVFKLYIQTTPVTRDLFIDSGSSNNYDDCTIWDMEHNINSRVGTAVMRYVKNGINFAKERYCTYLRRNRYHLIGRFTSFNSRVNHVLLSMVGYENYRNEFYIRGGNTPLVEKRIMGNDRLNDDFDFYVKDIGDGQHELYLHNKTNLEVEVVVYIESFRSFFPSPYTTYTSIGDSAKLDLVNYYPDNNVRSRIVLANENDYTGLTALRSFRYGITYSIVSGEVPESERGTPDNKRGLIVTNRTTPVGATYNFQEFHEFGSSNHNVMRRYAASETEWGNWG